MARKLLPDELWSEIEPLIPPLPAQPKGGRPPVGARQAPLGILFVLSTGIPWERLPYEVAGCSGMTCWRRLRAWQDADVWSELHRRLLEKLHRAGKIDWSRASVDASLAPAKGGRRCRSEPGRPRQTGVEASFRGRPSRHASRCPSDRRHRSRQQGAQRPNRRRPEPAGAARTTKTQTGRVARRQGLRFSPLPPRSAQARHHPTHRAKRDRVLAEARTPPLGRRAIDRLVQQIPTPPHTLRAQRRPLPRLPHNRRRYNLLQNSISAVVLGALILQL